MSGLYPRSPRLPASRITLGALAGLAGGAAEIAWIMLYSGLGDSDAAVVAQGITSTFSPTVATSPAGAAIGILIHVLIAVVLGIALTISVQRLLPRSSSALPESCLIVASLIVIWAINFYVVLPLINPEFVHVIPLEASLASKVLFGIGAAFVLSVAKGSKRRHSEFGGECRRQARQRA